MTTRKHQILALAIAALIILAFSVGSPLAAVQSDLRLDAESIETLKSIKNAGPRDDGFYTMRYQADYGLDDLMAKGGAKDQKTLNDFISARLLDGLPFFDNVLRMACSTFTATTPAGDRIHGRNMDLGGAQALVMRTQPKNGYKSLTMVSGLPLGYVKDLPQGLIGRLLLLAAPYYPTDGINEKGLSVAVLLLQDTPVRQETGKTPIVTMLAMRLMLDKAATVDEALKLLEQYDMHSIYKSNYHYHIADAQGKSAVVEYTDNVMRVIRPEGNCQVVTNFFLSPEKADVLSDGKADRSPKLQAALDESKGIVSQEKAWKMLKSVEAVHDYDTVTGIDFNTAYSIVYNNTKRTMDICINANFDVVYSYSVDGDF
ncbi:linear amide C-N hydrolase [Desulfovibrio sp. OttesenSCG-928-M14]|nr:linear amide C-N hydrolase [Desulfovibrio sp. OttesenSCG-928-M14]